MPYNAMKPKQKRIVERDVESLFSPKAILPKQTLEDIRQLGFFQPSIKFKGGTLYLSEKAIAALSRLTDTVCGLKEISDSVSRNEVSWQVSKSHNDWIEKLLQPTGQEFIDGVVDTLSATVKDYQFLAQIEGLDLKGQAVIQLGSYRIQRSDRALFEAIQFGGNLDIDSVYDQFKDTLWLIGPAKGSDDVASERFEHMATLTVGTLAICGAVLYRGAIWRSRVCAIISPLEHRKAISILRWERGGDNPSLKREWGREQDLPLDSQAIAHLNREYFLQRLASLPEQTDRSELEDAIVRSVYWFADAYRDPNPTMQFIKLWSCAECFFAIDKERVTDLNAKGFAVTLTFAGFRVIDVDDYPEFKRRVKELYELRSQAIHRAAFGHIKTKDLDDLSYWVAWVIISMVALSAQGYSTLRQVQAQTSRLDRLSDAKNTAVPSDEA